MNWRALVLPSVAAVAPGRARLIGPWTAALSARQPAVGSIASARQAAIAAHHLAGGGIGAIGVVAHRLLIAAADAPLAKVSGAIAVLGLARPGIAIEDPGCVSKTYPGFWDDLAALYRSVGSTAPWESHHA